MTVLVCAEGLQPVCRRCGELIRGARTIGAALTDHGWVCGYHATPEEHRAHLQRLLDNGGHL